MWRRRFHPSGNASPPIHEGVIFVILMHLEREREREGEGKKDKQPSSIFFSPLEIVKSYNKCRFIKFIKKCNLKDLKVSPHSIKLAP